jgi:Zn finger protein HypA/HybF involved in hydrogenase expression
MAYKGQEWDNKVIEASRESKSASEAAARLGIKYDTYKKHSIRLGVFVTNMSGKGLIKKKPEHLKINFNEVLKGNIPHVQTGAVKRYLLKSGIKENKCERCGLSEWMNAPISCHLDHINGDSHDHRLENLRILCPNCHSQTETYCGKSKGTIL